MKWRSTIRSWSRRCFFESMGLLRRCDVASSHDGFGQLGDELWVLDVDEPADRIVVQLADRCEGGFDEPAAAPSQQLVREPTSLATAGKPV